MVDITRITFVWNADFSFASGVRALKEAVEGHHRCTLCEIAYHRVTQTGEWKAYKKELRDEETIVYPLILAFCFLTFVAQRVAYPDMRPFKRLGEKTDCCV